MASEVLLSYNPTEIERRIGNLWESSGLFNVDSGSVGLKDKKFVMVIPPPNITGSLHIGHALTVSIQDCLTRWHRMRGEVTLWVPGTDHAGIATQIVVEKQLEKEGQSRISLGRERFVSRVWEWKEKYGMTINNQIRRMGASVDWSREQFTMTPQLSEAVKTAFCNLYDKGLIYRATKLVSWSCCLQTAISDIEVEQMELDQPTKLTIPGFAYPVDVGWLWHFKYQIYDSSETLSVATTRIETMLGDTAVAVHPLDLRYKHLIGKQVVHPFIKDRKMKVIADSSVDMSFGTGAVKITPAHDPVDFEMGIRHNLEFINILTSNGYINENGGIFMGQHRFECRFKIQQELANLGLIEEKIPNRKGMAIPICSRSNDLVEYMLLPQWWISCGKMAERACQVVSDGTIKLIPSFHESTWFHWLENIKDWCISRQLWWGHRIPAYEIVKPDCLKGKWVAGRDIDEAARKARVEYTLTDSEELQLVQDEDVLDTWFSSGLFPFAVFGWPSDTDDLKKFFPTSLLETGHDILFFWVARMVILSLELCDTVPFKEVYLHAIVRDAHGHKMSKSLGNVINPIDVMEGITLEQLHKSLESGNLGIKEINRAKATQKQNFPNGIPECGSDALRYGLLAYSKQGRALNLDINRVVGYRHFCNKIWNAFKFCIGSFEILPNTKALNFLFSGCNSTTVELQWIDQWIIHRLNICIKNTNDALSEFLFSDAVTATFNFWLYEFCDVYLEICKDRIARNRSDCAEVLYDCFHRGLRVLHPFLPFITEEIYSSKFFPKSNADTKFIAVSAYPCFSPQREYFGIDSEMDLVMSIVKQFRSLLAALEITPKRTIQGFIKCNVTETEKFLSKRCKEISLLAKLESVIMIDAGTDVSSYVPSVVNDKIDVYIQTNDSIKLNVVFEKMKKRLDTTQQRKDALVKKIESLDEKTPEGIKQMNQQKLDVYHEEISAMSDCLKTLKLLNEKELNNI